VQEICCWLIEKINRLWNSMNGKIKTHSISNFLSKRYDHLVYSPGKKASMLRAAVWFTIAIIKQAASYIKEFLALYSEGFRPI